MSNSNYTRCLCDHLTSFGAGLFVPPNTISFDTVFDDLGGKLLDNNAVFITICVIFLLYFLVLVWARRKDKQDRIKVRASPVVDLKRSAPSLPTAQNFLKFMHFVFCKIW